MQGGLHASIILAGLAHSNLGLAATTSLSHPFVGILLERCTPPVIQPKALPNSSSLQEVLYFAVEVT